MPVDDSTLVVPAAAAAAPASAVAAALRFAPHPPLVIPHGATEVTAGFTTYFPVGVDQNVRNAAHELYDALVLPPAPPDMQRAAAMQLQQRVDWRRAERQMHEEATIPEPLLQLTRKMWRSFGWLTSKKLDQQLYRYSVGGVPPGTRWHYEPPAELRSFRLNGSHEERRRVLAAAIRVVGKERRQKGETVRTMWKASEKGPRGGASKRWRDRHGERSCGWSQW